MDRNRLYVQDSYLRDMSKRTMEMEMVNVSYLSSLANLLPRLRPEVHREIPASCAGENKKLEIIGEEEASLPQDTVGPIVFTSRISALR